MKRIGILCASDTELAPFLTRMHIEKVTEKAMLKFYEGTFGTVDAVAVYSGVCKVNAAIAAQILIDGFGADAVINAGTAGGMDKDVELFDTIAAEQTVYHDVADDILTEFHPWMKTSYFQAAAAHVCYVNGIPFLSVRTVTDTAEHKGIENFEQNC